MNYTTLYFLTNERQSLVEIKKENLPKDTPKEEIYHWLSISRETKDVQKLKFQNMREEDVKGIKMNIRTFENAEVRFDKSYAKFVINGNGHILMNCSEENLPEDISKIIENYLS